MRNGNSYREERIKIIAEPSRARGAGRECRRSVAEQMPAGNHGVGAVHKTSQWKTSTGFARE